ncbi:hypothetical protein A2160_02090 [Candidatus Beckwithbacteria bacterium RBG_13_42_9]|uniref:Uncharacterized protein n=1 Tax=Candidatus Beckwithbacteria bacterium RBG_13_42_9 TaxID=1797457 RepID=A0A1F5E7Q0_9BACT|nr:MAG: hypothetical protein A2160_02090 [Candidatus Beckwithbacteria bacterium RBG_13_42_9]
MTEEITVTIVNFAGKGWGSECAIPTPQAEAALKLLGSVIPNPEGGWTVAIGDDFRTSPFGDLPKACWIETVEGAIIGHKLPQGTTFINLEQLETYHRGQP